MSRIRETPSSVDSGCLVRNPSRSEKEALGHPELGDAPPMKES